MPYRNIFAQVTAVAVALVMQSLSPLVANAAPTDSESGSVTNAQISPSNATNGFYKIITDQELGKYAIVNTSKNVVTLKDKAGNIIWSTNVVAAIKSVPMSGERKINSMNMIDGDIVVTVSRAFVRIDKKTGEIKSHGSD
jgi:hypothetical protein